MAKLTTLVPADVSEAELIQLVRAGDLRSMGELYRRHHPAALRLARGLAGPDGADDLASTAFVAVLALLRRGAGPTCHFRAYLVAAVRNTHLNSTRTSRREDLVEHWDALCVQPDDLDRRLDHQQVARAFTALQPRWRHVLWLCVVEGRTHSEIAELMGITPNAVAALAFRARAGLRRAYLAPGHLASGV